MGDPQRPFGAGSIPQTPNPCPELAFLSGTQSITLFNFGLWEFDSKSRRRFCMERFQEIMSRVMVMSRKKAYLAEIDRFRVFSFF